MFWFYFSCKKNTHIWDNIIVKLHGIFWFHRFIFSFWNTSRWSCKVYLLDILKCFEKIWGFCKCMEQLWSQKIKKWEKNYIDSAVVARSLLYFVLLNYSYKYWSNIKTRDSFRICSSWGFKNCHWKLNLTKIWLRKSR